MGINFGLDPVRAAATEAVGALGRGERVGVRTLLDLKEETGRRDKKGRLLPGQFHNEKAAEQLAGECACMANTPGGGALLVGVADDSTVVGTQLDEGWLRHRIYTLLNRSLTVDVRAADVSGTRILVLIVPEAVEPIRFRNKITWRVDDHCVEMDATSWHTRNRDSLLVDWSAQPSRLSVDAAREAAVEAARDFLRASNDPSAQELAEVRTRDLVRRLNAVTSDGFLTNAGALLFVGRERPCVDYIRRDVAGGDSTERIRRADRSLIEQLTEVFTTARAHNPMTHVGSGPAVGQLRQLPERALREAIVNGVAHREWSATDPTVVEHLGGILRVTSPGGFFGGVTAENIINHVSKSRNTALAELLARIKIAEREGIGVDRMVGDMLRLGYEQPEIREVDTPAVVTSLVGAAADKAWIAWLNRIGDGGAAEDLPMLMSVRYLVDQGWADAKALGPYLQLSPAETADVMRRLLNLRLNSRALVYPVEGQPGESRDAALVLSQTARSELKRLDRSEHVRRSWPTREQVALSYAAGRGRISSTELASLVVAEPPNVQGVLRGLESDGLLRPSRPNRRGAGFHYIFVPPEGARLNMITMSSTSLARATPRRRPRPLVGRGAVHAVLLL